MTQKTTNAITSEVLRSESSAANTSMLSNAYAQQSDRQNSAYYVSQTLAQAELEQYLEQQAAEIAPFTIRADELTQGDIIKHFAGDTWLVISEPQYTCSGIEFKVLWLNVDSPDNTQSVCFAPQWRFELVSFTTQCNTSSDGRAA